MILIRIIQLYIADSSSQCCQKSNNTHFLGGIIANLIFIRWIVNKASSARQNRVWGNRNANFLSYLLILMIQASAYFLSCRSCCISYLSCDAEDSNYGCYEKSFGFLIDKLFSQLFIIKVKVFCFNWRFSVPQLKKSCSEFNVFFFLIRSLIKSLRMILNFSKSSLEFKSSSEHL